MTIKAILFAGIAALSLTACVEETSSSSSYNKHVLVVNNSGKTIREFYGSNAGTSSWQEDILGSDVLASGSSVDINFEDGSGYCSFDFLAVFTDGSSVVESGIDVCAVSTVEVN
ncbi:hypothetical protein NX862_10080 [Rhodobacter sp. KR11]|jgi:hypothetical protein|uniref:hypothetical protein n=1 Tax=Rhodobacter sp. KR11 TaxID=2974588 RepID=UPI002222B3A2|nr:hypothetical protein [Rhodobacter sp. KR11]MCW1919106.1 hypothetical protein [Rhodobacter sp. KR11]